jgi:APA family basic amino acid/polyamine antiporter
MADLFTFIVLLATTGCLFAYFFTALAALKLQSRRQLEKSFVLTCLAIVSAVYSLWAIWGAGRNAALWGSAAFLIALPLYAAMRWSHRGIDHNPSAQIVAGD